MFHRIFIGLVCISLFFATVTVRAEKITVFAAASLTDAMLRIYQSYTDQTGDKLILSFASSSTLARQIAAGAPADIYISANKKWMDWLAERKMIANAKRHDLLGNALVLIAPKNSSLAPFKFTAETDLSALLGEKDYLALGNPDNVPAGIYAKQSLLSLGQWKRLEAHLAQANDVRAALALVEHEEAPLGIVYATDATISKNVKVLAQFPKDSHLPIIYPIAIVAGHESPKAIAFLDWLSGDEAGAIFRKYGFAHLLNSQGKNRSN